jgi:hypothetical protein
MGKRLDSLIRTLQQELMPETEMGGPRESNGENGIGMSAALSDSSLNSIPSLALLGPLPSPTSGQPTAMGVGEPTSSMQGLNRSEVAELCLAGLKQVRDVLLGNLDLESAAQTPLAAVAPSAAVAAAVASAAAAPNEPAPYRPLSASYPQAQTNTQVPSAPSGAPVDPLGVLGGNSFGSRSSSNAKRDPLGVLA